MIRGRIKKVLRRLRNRILPRESDETSGSSFTEQRTVEEEPVHPFEDEEEVNLEIESPDIERWLSAGEKPYFVDIRQPHEVRGGYIPNALLLPMSHVPAHLSLFPKDRPIVLYCAAGVRSFGIAHFMREKGFENAWSLIGGVAEWREFYQPPSSSTFSILEKVRYMELEGTVQNISLQEDTEYYDVLCEDGQHHFQLSAEVLSKG